MTIPRDQAYCASKGCKGRCGRQLSDEQKKEANRYSLSLWYGYFCDPKGNVIEDRKDL